MIHRTRIVTFPRSGHTWLAELIYSALGEELVYSEHHSSGGTLESDASINVQKTHDFELNVHPYPEFKHIVQIRNFPDSVHSWYKIKPNSPHPFEEDYSLFVANAKKFRSGFELKWIIGEIPSRLIIDYEALCWDTEHQLCKALLHITDMAEGECCEAAKEAVLKYPSKAIL